MTPTPKLRFVERKSSEWQSADIFQTVRMIKVLQQWWVDTDEVFDTVTKDIRGEWRDVPLEKEND